MGTTYYPSQDAELNPCLDNFIHHISGGVLAGAACGVAAGMVYHLAPMDEPAGGVLCTVGSILPDIDSPQSKPKVIFFDRARNITHVS